jgi:hypothetical protein
MDPIRAFTAVVLVALPTLIYGGYSLLRLLGQGHLSEFQRTYFRAGHAHAGVLLVFALAYLAFLSRTDFGDGLRWLASGLLTVGILAQSGGMFLHMGVGETGRWSVGNSLTTAGALVLAASSLLLAYGVATSSHL